jgi:hypothetical protein
MLMHTSELPCLSYTMVGKLLRVADVRAGECSLWSQTSCVQILAPSLTMYVTLGELPCSPSLSSPSINWGQYFLAGVWGH